MKYVSNPKDLEAMRMQRDGVVEEIKKQLEVKSIIELTSFCPEHFDVFSFDNDMYKEIAYELVRTGLYEMKEEYDSIDGIERFYIWRVPKKHWTVRNPFLFAVITSVIAGVVSLLVVLATNQAQDQRDSRQENNLLNLSDSLTKFQIVLRRQLNDSLSAIRADTTFSRSK